MDAENERFVESGRLLRIVSEWPLDEQLSFASRILYYASEAIRPRDSVPSAEELRAALGIDRDLDVSDDQIEEWLHERRMARAK